MMGSTNIDQFVSTRIETWLHKEQPQTSTLDIPELGAAVGTTIGQVRKENQDRTIIARLSNMSGLPPTTIFAVCDGMGGMVDGRQCAEKTLAILLNSFIQSQFRNIKDRLWESIMAANKEIFRQYHQRGGTTLAVFCRSSDISVAASVGDTRVYSFGTGTQLKQISIDDTIAGELNRKKGFHTENIQLEPFANQLAQFIGIGEELEPRMYNLPFQTDISYLIASDGAYNIGTAFERILLNASSPFLAVERIISASLWMGGKDNATIICIRPDRIEYQSDPRESMLEFWNTAGKIEFIPWHGLQIPERQSPVPTYHQEPINSKKDRSRKSMKGKDKPEQQRNEPRNPNPSRPTLEINFGKPTDRDPVKDTNSKPLPTESKLIPDESCLTSNKSEEKTNDPYRSDVQNS
jgi:PPM family protein phosphatase